MLYGDFDILSKALKERVGKSFFYIMISKKCINAEVPQEGTVSIFSKRNRGYSKEVATLTN